MIMPSELNSKENSFYLHDIESSITTKVDTFTIKPMTNWFSGDGSKNSAGSWDASVTIWIGTNFKLASWSKGLSPIIHKISNSIIRKKKKSALVFKFFTYWDPFPHTKHTHTHTWKQKHKNKIIKIFSTTQLANVIIWFLRPKHW